MLKDEAFLPSFEQASRFGFLSEVMVLFYSVGLLSLILLFILFFVSLRSEFKQYILYTLHQDGFVLGLVSWVLVTTRVL